ncbi:uncharacterized protein LOC100528641 [Ictalurus punctatus]|uniref:Mitochondrial uncharacterized protein f13e9.13 n=1 Tax=Ictalurus punctatus TaxID=7998 RepID=E3TFV6_ICTPU|nr:uncharacterized protein LOC100528641 [Ictalurus punctatus]ADO29192.1 mitochondrial uncharacterized protein f13e9.13 [Ictalurus punctatus]
MKFVKLFGRLKSNIIGMIHVGALPGTPLHRCAVPELIEEACREAELYHQQGLDGFLIENMHDVPYVCDSGPEVCAVMTAVCSAVKKLRPALPVGVQVLAANNQTALAIALASGLDFIRAEGFVFCHVADEGLMNACAGDLLRYRKHIGAEHIQIFTDIKKKHSAHALTADVCIAETARAAEFFLSDGVVVTGPSTGVQANPQELSEVMRSVRIPVLIGSGVTHENVEDYLEANALIIGSHFKTGGRWERGVDPERVKRLMEKIHKLRN